MYSINCKNPACGKPLVVKDLFSGKLKEVQGWSLGRDPGEYNARLSDGMVASDGFIAETHQVQACECGLMNPAEVWPKWKSLGGEMGVLEALRLPMRRDCTKRHPEQGDDEVFVSNTTVRDFQEWGWKTGRLGVQAYTLDGDLIGGFVDNIEEEAFRPGFVKSAEVLEFGLEINERTGTLVKVDAVTLDLRAS